MQNFIPLSNNGFFQGIQIGYPSALVYILFNSAPQIPKSTGFESGLFSNQWSDSSNRKCFLSFKISRMSLAVWALAVLHEETFIIFCQSVHFSNHFLLWHITTILRIYLCIQLKKFKVKVYDIPTKTIICFVKALISRNYLSLSTSSFLIFFWT